MITVALVTAASMPKPDTESHLLLRSFERRGIGASLQPWDGSFDWASADLVVVRTPWDYVDRLDEFLHWADRIGSMTALVNPPDVLRWNTHKSYLLDLAAGGVPTVPTRILPMGTSSVDVDALSESREIVVKPCVSIGAIGALRTRVDDPRAVAHITELAATGDVLVQPFVPSVLHSGETSLVFAGDRLSHAVRKVPAPGDYRVQDHHGGSVLPHRANDDEIAVARAALAVAPSPVSYARIDLVCMDSGPVVMELELVEPALFLEADPRAAETFVDSFLAAIDPSSGQVISNAGRR